MPLYYSLQGLFEMCVSANIYGVTLERHKELQRGIFFKFPLFCPTLQKFSSSFEVFFNYKFLKIPLKYSRRLHAYIRTEGRTVIGRCCKRERDRILIYILISKFGLFQSSQKIH